MRHDGSLCLVTKDILIKEYLSVYSKRKCHETPNLDVLAQKGTVFMRHYTAAPSTAMAMAAMLTGRYPYQTKNRYYVPVNSVDTDGKNLFNIAEARGLKSHILWSKNYMKAALPFLDCVDSGLVKIHTIDINQTIGPHNKNTAVIERNVELENRSMDTLFDAIVKIMHADEKIFLWIHLPHVLKGRSGYGDDIDLLDKTIGKIREYISDEAIYISADHGNMNGQKGKYGYGFDVYESAISIPLITPRIGNNTFVEFPTSNRDIGEIIFNHSIPQNQFVLSDTAYYAQPNRKIAIIQDRYKYIYNKFKRAEELYDILFDPSENVNLLDQVYFDPDRRIRYDKREAYYYPYWPAAIEAARICRAQKNELWKTGAPMEELWERLKFSLKHVKYKYRQLLGK
ncbi:sulfatase-like hydrolase/transferase [Eubacteriales bacterium OttesenSCG-928-A19]|nr:sulfatase-like hydrolase/transferase [Eubacteriales bacterium OttesenSCG-928-A19]